MNVKELNKFTDELNMISYTAYKKGTKVIVDKGRITESIVTVRSQSKPYNMFTNVVNDKNYDWDVMTNRLSLKPD